MTISKKNLNDRFKYYFTILLAFLFVFGAPFTFLPINSSKLIILFLIVLLFFEIITTNKIDIKINKNIFIVSFMLLLLFVVSLLYVLGHNTMDFSIPYAYFIFLVEALFGGYLLYKFFLKNYSFEEVLHILIIISLIQAFIIIGMFALEPFRDFIFAIAGSKADLMERYGGFRGFGLAGSVTYDLAVFLSINMIFISYLVSQSSKNIVFYLVSWVVIFIAVLMTGRTGWIGVFLSIIFIIMNIKNKNALKSAIYLLISIIVFTILFIYVLIYFFPEIYETLVLHVVPYAFEMFINFSKTGSFSTSSSGLLQKMYFDVTENTFLFGDGYWANPTGFGYYMGTDAGYMRHILFYGIFPSIFLYIFYFFSFYKMIYYTKHTFQNVLFLSMLCGYYFLVHYKGDFLTGSAMNIKLFAILFICIVMSNYSSSNELINSNGYKKNKELNEKNIIYS
jgi:hypothetical protein